MLALHGFDSHPEELGHSKEWHRLLSVCPGCRCSAARLIYKGKSPESEGEVPYGPDLRDDESGFAWASLAASSVLLLCFQLDWKYLVKQFGRHAVRTVDHSQIQWLLILWVLLPL